MASDSVQPNWSMHKGVPNLRLKTSDWFYYDNSQQALEMLLRFQDNKVDQIDKEVKDAWDSDHHVGGAQVVVWRIQSWKEDDKYTNLA